MTDEAAQMPVLILVRDLIFASRIRAAAESAGFQFRMIRDPKELSQLDGSRLIVDLNQPGAVEGAAHWAQARGKPVIGFVSHVDQETIEAARKAGIPQILPRSRFVQLLPQLLR